MCTAITRRSSRPRLLNGKPDFCTSDPPPLRFPYSVVNIPLRAGASHVGMYTCAIVNQEVANYPLPIDLPVQLRDPRKLQGNDKSKKDYQSTLSDTSFRRNL